MTKKLRLLTKWFFNLHRSRKRLILIFIDLLIAVISIQATSMLTAGLPRLFTLPNILFLLAGPSLSLIFALQLRGFYNSFTRHFSVDEVNTIIIGSLVSSLQFFGSLVVLEIQNSIAVAFIYLILINTALIGTRFSIRLFGQKINENKPRNAAIYGANLEAIQLANALKWHPSLRVRMLIDDQASLNGQTISGIPIKNFDQAKKSLEMQDIEFLLVAIPTIDDIAQKKFAELLRLYPIRIKKIPSISDAIASKSKIHEFNDISIQDLIGRNAVAPVENLLKPSIKNNTVLVTGAGGSIGSEICRQILLWEPRELILLDVSEYSTYRTLSELLNTHSNVEVKITPIIGSIQDKKLITHLFQSFEIDTVYHAAAYKHVPLMEQNIIQCIQNNVFGTMNVVESSVANKVKNFILVSSDKAVNPSSFMGASKRLAEKLCQSAASKKQTTRITIVRFGNVLGSSGSVVPLFKQQIDNGGPVTVTHPEVTRYFMTISEAAQLVIQAAALAKGGEIFVLDMGEPISIMRLAEQMIKLAGKQAIFDESEKNGSNIFVQVTGLRSGEKLAEELSYTNNLEKTRHPRINISKEGHSPSLDTKKTIKALSEAISDRDIKLLACTLAAQIEARVDFDYTGDAFFRKNID